jgi:hypothetical protein
MSGGTPRMYSHSVERDNFNIYRILSFGHLPIAENYNHFKMQGFHVEPLKKTSKGKPVEYTFDSRRLFTFHFALQQQNT